MITSKLTSKGQTTVPQPIRAVLRLSEGDELEYRVQGKHVILTKLERPIDDPFRTFQEWYSDADEKAYADL